MPLLSLPPNSRVRIFSCFASLLLTIAVRAESPVAENAAAIAEPARAEKQLREERENLRAALQAASSFEEKQRAVENFQAAVLRQVQAEEPAPEEKAAMRQQVLEDTAARSPELHERLREQFDFSGQVEAVKDAALFEEEKALRLGRLAEERRQAVEARMAELAAEAAQQPASDLEEALTAEKAALKEALGNGDPEQRRQALQEFQAAVRQKLSKQSAYPDPEGRRDDQKTSP